MDKVAKGMSQASQPGCCTKGPAKGKGIAQTVKDLANEAIGRVKNYVNSNRQKVKR